MYQASPQQGVLKVPGSGRTITPSPSSGMSTPVGMVSPGPDLRQHPTGTLSPRPYGGGGYAGSNYGTIGKNITLN